MIHNDAAATKQSGIIVFEPAIELRSTVAAFGPLGVIDRTSDAQPALPTATEPSYFAV
jgi:hypothetical protein